MKLYYMDWVGRWGHFLFCYWLVVWGFFKVIGGGGVGKFLKGLGFWGLEDWI